MPVGKEAPLHLKPIDGVRIGTAKAGIRQQERDDVTVFEISESARVEAFSLRMCFVQRQC